MYRFRGCSIRPVLIKSENMNPSNTLRSKRRDLSPYLFHFTKGEDPKGCLSTILDEQRLRSERGYICFTESPLSSANVLFEYLGSFKKPMYSKYGIGFERDVLIEQFKARPVIYGDQEDFKMIGNGLNWRYEELDVHTHDYTWLREWRICGNEFDFSTISKEDIIVIAPTKEDLKVLVAVEDFEEMDFSIIEGRAYPTPIYRLARTWKGISFEEAVSYNSDNEMSIDVFLQDIDEAIK